MSWNNWSGGSLPILQQVASKCKRTFNKKQAMWSCLLAANLIISVSLFGVQT